MPQALTAPATMPEAEVRTVANQALRPSHKRSSPGAGNRSQ